MKMTVVFRCGDGQLHGIEPGTSSQSRWSDFLFSSAQNQRMGKNGKMIFSILNCKTRQERLGMVVVRLFHKASQPLDFPPSNNSTRSLGPNAPGAAAGRSGLCGWQPMFCDLTT